MCMARRAKGSPERYGLAMRSGEAAEVGQRAEVVLRGGQAVCVAYVESMRHEQRHYPLEETSSTGNETSFTRLSVASLVMGSHRFV